ncbi:MMPL family transporter [Allostreptomyces psammosilenae]|uniref:RND superfamily putative drug exporter n=1 Tax=Allostreptomyces psammosilenae TaxID=1892865 RepID=A0A852ZR92_9ACTN|nr:MMPL family transporter [Allostreptomyces psammosilenae]NYI04007.1 RND superfamily putative drug exporter [Allostreptomyces psammosilenae]
MFILLGRFTYRRRRAVLIAAGVFAVLAGIWGSGVFGAMGSGGYAPPGVESVRANELLEEEFGHGENEHDVIAVYVDPTDSRTVDDPEFADAVRAALDGLPDSHVASVTSYWTEGLPASERALLVSEDRHATYATLTLEGADAAERLENYGEIVDGVRAEGGLETYLGGGFTSEHQLQELASANLATAQVISLPLLLLFLVIIFRGLVAGATPILLGIFAILGSLTLLRMLTYVTEISIFALEITILLGLGLAIDYGLFIVSRFREELARRGGDVAEALPATMATAGRTVAFSGLTVVISLCGLLLFPQPASRSFGLGGVTVVLFNIVAAVVVLPAMLAVLGQRINALRIPWPRRTVTEVVAERTGAWARLAWAIMRRPVPWLAGAIGLLLIAAAPLLSLEPGLTNHRYLPTDNEGQVSLRIIDEEFPEDGPATPVLDIAVVGGVEQAALEDYLRRLEALDAAGEAEVVRGDAELTHVTVTWQGESDDPANLQLVRDARAEEWPAGATEVLVGGEGGPALSLDSNEATLDALPWALGVVVLVTLVLLFFAFGSVILPIKAVLVAFFSLAASLGIVVWGFQDGGFASVLGFEAVGTTDLWTLGLIVIIAFGLVTDYEMFVVSRAREEYLVSGDNERAVAVGLQSTGGIISSAALLMVIVLAAMGVTATSLFLMTIGIGLTFSIVIDATIVRGVLVPATMRLLGSVNWWAPGPLRRLHDRLGISEGEAVLPPAGGVPAASGSGQERRVAARK